MSKCGRLSVENCVLVIIDLQEKFSFMFKNCHLPTKRLADGCNLLGVPIILTEQNPLRLGRTDDHLKEYATNPVEKNTFSAAGDDVFMERLVSCNRKQVILCGIESHVCVLQTLLDLTDLGYEVHLVEECVSSRKDSDKEICVSRARKVAYTESVETVLFQLMSDFKNPLFKQVQKLVV